MGMLKGGVLANHLLLLRDTKWYTDALIYWYPSNLDHIDNNFVSFLQLRVSGHSSTPSFSQRYSYSYAKNSLF